MQSLSSALNISLGEIVPGLGVARRIVPSKWHILYIYIYMYCTKAIWMWICIYIYLYILYINIYNYMKIRVFWKYGIPIKIVFNCQFHVYPAFRQTHMMLWLIGTSPRNSAETTPSWGIVQYLLVAQELLWVTGWCPPVISWFIITDNYSYIYPKP